MTKECDCPCASCLDEGYEIALRQIRANALNRMKTEHEPIFLIALETVALPWLRKHDQAQFWMDGQDEHAHLYGVLARWCERQGIDYRRKDVIRDGA